MNGRIFIKRGTKVIGTSAYDGWEDINAICMPEGVRSINDYAFNECLNLREVRFPKRTLKEIGEQAFFHTGLTEIKIPDSVEFIDRRAFLFNSELRYVHIGKNVQYIGPGAFSACPNLERITVDPNNSYFYAENGCLIEKKYKKLIVSCYPYVVPEGVEIIGRQCFIWLTNCECVTLPKSVKQIYVRENEVSNFKICFNIDETGKHKTKRLFTIVAPKDSYSERFAKEHDINFEEV